jgi:hypothetical protein
MNYKNFLILILINFYISSCRRCPDCESPPLFISMRIVDKNSNIDLMFSKSYHIDSLQIFYLEKGLRKLVKIQTVIDTTNGKVFIGSSDWCEKSADGITEFFLRFNKQDTDTVHLQSSWHGDECCWSQSINRFEINGVQLLNDSNDFSKIYKK